ncbi:Mur ligase family protein [Celeribacter sp.]|uniref:Mur ligase family protein n=1 Tax=Celeribacter sp. TaxID=1890673 RepID=UPI003A8CE3C4
MSNKERQRGPVRKLLFKFRTGPQKRIRMRSAARRRLKSSARFVAVTGSSGKSTTAGLLSHILQAYAPTQSQVGSNTVSQLIRTLKRMSLVEHFVVTELGVSAKSKMEPMASMLCPDVAIVTMIGTEHYSAFRGREGVAKEKGALLDHLQEDGFAVLNADDEMVMDMAQRTRARKVTFGKDAATADYRAEDIQAGFPDMLSFTLVGKGQRLELKTLFPGEHFWMPVTAAVVTALELGVPAELVAAQVATFSPVNGRCSIVQAPDGPTFILDSTKAPYGTLDLAFDMLAKAKAPHKRVILGIISDYSGASSQKYRNAWRTAREISDQVIFVGKSISSAKPTREDVESGRIIGFENAHEAFEHIKATARPDEVILIKGSTNLHLERIALGYTQPVQCWAVACGKPGGCFRCPGLLLPFDKNALKRKEKLDRLAFWKPRKI